MDMTIEEEIPLEEIAIQLTDIRVLRGDPKSTVDACRKLKWERPARVWTFRPTTAPPTEKLEAFMDTFERVFAIHEGRGDYQAAWWKTTETDSDELIIKGLFTDLNPDTGPGFFKRAGDGPRIAIWFGRIQKIVEG